MVLFEVFGRNTESQTEEGKRKLKELAESQLYQSNCHENWQ